MKSTSGSTSFNAQTTPHNETWLSSTGPVPILMSSGWLKAGDIYQNVKPVIQIGLLDYTLFPECPEFYATYEFRNAQNHHLYSDRLRLCVLDLNRIDLATEEDKFCQIDHWAFLFKSATWEEIRICQRV